MASLLLRFLASLPLWLNHKLGAAAGWLTWALSPTYRRRLGLNLNQALGEPAATAMRAEAIAQAGRQALELPWILLRPQHEATSMVTQVSGWDAVEAARASGGGILFITPHLGCFEITAQYYSMHGPITVLYRKPKQASLDPLIQAGRNRGLQKAAPADAS
ncbi:MAG: lysophospholipid acyltransferase family protein, partial [Zoogloea sp.]|nr:lysophospholipid acyltransferase family protein [Zoogloea sp.]